MKILTKIFDLMMLIGLVWILSVLNVEEIGVVVTTIMSGIIICCTSILFLDILPKDYKRIQIIYHTNDIDKIKRIPKGDWIDLRSAEDVMLKKGEFKLINLGVSMKLPDGYEAHIAARSSTYKNFCIIQSNGIGIVDNSYSGTNDIWMFPALATKDTVIHKNDRICQFRIVPIQEKVHFIETNILEDTNRGGFGSTGK